MDIKYPNLELLVYKAKHCLNNYGIFKNKLKKVREETGWKCVSTEYDIIVFPQWWGSTCIGFDMTEDGEPVISGCAITKEYTTVVHEKLTGIYVVFFGDKICYVVDEANDRFLKDLNNRNLAGMREALKVYL